MQIYRIIITTCDSLSLIGSILIIALFLKYTKLRQGLFTRIVLYLTIADLIQLVGIEFATITYQTICPYSVGLMIYGSLSMIMWSIVMMWSISQIFHVQSQGGSLEDLELKHKQLELKESKFAILSFGLPLVLAIWPIINRTTLTQPTNPFCYIYTSPTQSTGMRFLTDLEKLIIWEIPILIYLAYSTLVIVRIRRVFAEDDESLFHEVQKLILRLLAFPVVTLLCTIQFTIQDIETFFGVHIDTPQSTASMSFLALWGFFNALAYLVQTSVQRELGKGDQELVSHVMYSLDLGSSTSSNDYFYFHKEGNSSSAINKNL